MTKLLAFDIETMGLPTEDYGTPVGITCIAALPEDQTVRFWYNPEGGVLEPKRVLGFLGYLEDMYHLGYIPIGWNCLGFDFKVLWMESILDYGFRNMALRSYDPMFQFLCYRGFPVSLQAVSIAMGLEGKTKEVNLNDGSVLHGMNGGQAIELWQKGEIKAVLAYLEGDVQQTLKVGLALKHQKMLAWQAKSGKFNLMPFPFLMTAEECMESIPLPDTSWMDTPIPRANFFQWTNWEEPTNTEVIHDPV